MRLQDIPEKSRDALIDIILSDPDGVHVLWNCAEGTVTPVGECCFPAGSYDPFDYIRDNCLVSDEHRRIYDVYYDSVHNAIFNGTDSYQTEVRLAMDTGSGADMKRLLSIFLRDEEKRVTQIHIVIRPFTERDRAVKRLLDGFTSDKDPDFIYQTIRTIMAKHPDSNYAFIQFDIDKFKLINDSEGSDTGDALLRFIHDTLESVCGDEQPFVRLNSDIFLIVTTFGVQEDIVTLIRWIESNLLGFRGLEYRFTFGVAIVECERMNTRKHIDHANLARRSVKDSAIRNIAFYEPSLKNDLYRRRFIEEDMEHALENREFRMYLQPKYSISTGRIIGAEALSRWIHPEKGLIPPAEFIPVFEQNGFILKLDLYIWECACQKLREWIDNGIEPVPISVNISREYLDDFDVVSKFAELVKKYDIPIDMLEAEITETVDSPAATTVVHRMKSVGFTMLMDDFGSGYSSLSMLRTAPFDVLKLDRRFLSEFIENDRGRKIIAHTISMSRDIGLGIIAEGVETPEQAEFLRLCGCDAVQGFLYSKPVNTEDFDAKLLASNGKDDK